MEHSFDMHIHSRHSWDCESTLEAIFEQARRRGLSGVAITDHDSFGGSEEALSLAPRDLLIIPGVELSTPYGHILCYFPKRSPERAGLKKGKDGFFPFDEVCAYAREEDAVLFAAHPYRGKRFTEDILPQLVGIEAFNGGNTPRHEDANERALALARARRLPVSAGSDAHVPAGVGMGARIFRLDEPLTLEAVRRALCTPGGAVYGQYAPAAAECFQNWRTLRSMGRQKSARRELIHGLGAALVYDPLAPLRPSTRAIARGAVFETGEETR